EVVHSPAGTGPWPRKRAPVADRATAAELDREAVKGSIPKDGLPSAKGRNACRPRSLTHSLSGLRSPLSRSFHILRGRTCAGGLATASKQKSPRSGSDRGLGSARRELRW